MDPRIKEALQAALAAIEVLTQNLTGPVKPHPFGLIVIDAKQRIRNALAGM
jgi:hypothetical protein